MSPGSPAPAVTLDHVALSVGDLGRQAAFYQRALGFEEEARAGFPSIGVTTVMLRLPSGAGLELVSKAGSSPQRASDPASAAAVQTYFHCALAVDDLARALATATAAGGTLVAGPAAASRPGVTYAYFLDPEGNLVELLQHRRLQRLTTAAGCRPARSR
jgi:catechol 2,3-dioxygenase-like lactoylglutathione lyase family enzyme